MRKISVETGYFESFDGTKIYYETRGKGKPLVFVYGIGCLFNHWAHQVKYFSKNYKVILYDFRAHHKSSIPENPNNLNMESMAKDIDCLMKHLKLEKATFIGHSFGGQVIIKTYDLFPDYFSNIVFINCFIRNPIEGMFGSDLPRKIFEYLKKGYDLLPETISTLWKMVINSPLFIPITGLSGGFNLALTPFKDIEIYAKGISSVDLNSFIKLFEQMMKYDGRDVLERVKVPALIIAGAKDSVTPRKHQEEMHSLLPDSEYTIMPYGSHCTQLDLPIYVNLRVEKFLKSKKYY